MLFLACVLFLSTVGDETRTKFLLALCFLRILEKKQKESIVTIGIFLVETGNDLYGDD